MTTQEQLERNVRSIARDIQNPEESDWWQEVREDSDGEEPTAYDYLRDALDIEYTISRSREYLGARVLVAFGGPNIWINTRTNTVEGYWASSKAEASYIDTLGLDDAIADIYSAS